MENSMDNSCVKVNDRSVQPKSAKKPKIDLLENMQYSCTECLLELKSKKTFDTIFALEEHYSDDHFTNSPDKMNQPTKMLRPDDDNALLEAIRKNNLADVLHIIENGANINPNTDNFMFLKSPLFLAIDSGNEQIVEALISKGAKMDINDSNGDYPIHFAVRHKKKEIICVLADHRADIDIRNRRYQISPLEIAIIGGNKEIVETLVSNGAKINLQDTHGDFPIHKAIYYDNEEIVSILIKHGAIVDAKDKYGETPLHKAVERNNKQIIELLLNQSEMGNGFQTISARWHVISHWYEISDYVHVSIFDFYHVADLYY